MKRSAKDAALECCRLALSNRTQSGKHIEPITKLILDDMERAGYDPASLFSKGRDVILPGWFRPAKQWDIVAYEQGAFVGAIELKSISSSFGNNANNRVEESIGSAIDVDHATRNHLLGPTTLRPNFGYVLIVNENEESSVQRKVSSMPSQGVDPVFNDSSYIDRFVVMGQRLLEERIYQAVWIAAVDLEAKEVREPSEQATYSKFLANVKSWIDIARA